MRPSLVTWFTLVVALCTACWQRPTASDHVDSSAKIAADRSAVSARLRAHRTQQIERLEAYATAGEFPHNYAQPTAAHIFRDEAGRLCAVANLVHQDGRDDLVDTTARNRNDLAIADVQDGAIFEWVLGSGLTQEELVRLQLVAIPLPRPPRPRPSRDLVAKNAADAELRMNVAVRQHVESVAQEFRANSEASLDIATARFVAHRDRTGSTPAALAAN